jgi:hypothetical protein
MDLEEKMVPSLRSAVSFQFCFPPQIVYKTRMRALSLQQRLRLSSSRY